MKYQIKDSSHEMIYDYVKDKFPDKLDIISLSRIYVASPFELLKIDSFLRTLELTILIDMIDLCDDLEKIDDIQEYDQNIINKARHDNLYYILLQKARLEINEIVAEQLLNTLIK